MSTLRASIKMFGGRVQRLTHRSAVTKTDMDFTVFVPPQASKSRPVPTLFWLSGLTCTDENFLTKAGAQKRASELGIAIVMPDTSPRGAGIAGEDDFYDFGSGAGFYLDATEPDWKENYNMYSYVTEELPELLSTDFPELCNVRQGIFGHSMGGHGALICALKNPGKYRSVSAFSPICNPIECPWGQKAFSGYLGEDNKEWWKRYDATELVSSYKGPPIHVLVDQGAADNFYIEKQLLPENFERACASNDNVRATLRIQPEYDHSYYFIATFVDDHLDHHASSLLDS